ncbi:MAG: nucleotidyltransferase domain-containing protein [Actinobacteria bacterium]|nr:nucleotidyltransferase domain-containing protein [Actinomycetota bacterium]
MDRPELLEKLQQIAGTITERHKEVSAIHLFGSVARGDHTGLSDVDILIVLRQSDQSPVERIRSFFPYFDLPVGVDLVVYTEEELKRMEELSNPFLERVNREGMRLA